MSYFAVARSDDRRFLEWLRCFGGDCVPIVSGRPVPVHLIGMGREIPVYFADLKRLGPSGVARAVCFLAEKFGEPRQVVRDRIDSLGLPLVAEGLAVCSDPDEGRRRANRGA